MRWVVTYDIVEDRRRDHAASLLLAVGWRIQFSVFEIEVPDGRIGDLVEDLVATIDERTDRVHLFPDCACKTERIMIGQASLPSEERFYIV